MPIIKHKKANEKCSIKAKVKPEVLVQIEMYCNWAGIYDFGYFIEKASKELFLKDPDWTVYQRQMEEETVNELNCEMAMV